MRKTLLIVALGTTYVVSAAAQTGDKIQTKSVWGATYKRADLDKTPKFEAYNPATETFYTLSNDNDNLYLAIQARTPIIIEKAIKGGIVFTISQTKNTDNDDSKLVVKYPLMSRDEYRNLKTSVKPQATDEIEKNVEIKNFVTDENKKINSAAKTIRLTASKAKTDTLSIYNEKGIQVMSFLDYNLHYNYQLTFPLSYLSAFSNKSNFFYNVALPGFFGDFSREITEGITAVHVVNGEVKIEGPSAPLIAIMSNKTDFTGEYKLATQ